MRACVWAPVACSIHACEAFVNFNSPLAFTSRFLHASLPGTLLVMTTRDTAPGAGCWQGHTESEPESKTAFSLHTPCELLFGHLETECVRASRYRRPKRAPWHRAGWICI